MIKKLPLLIIMCSILFTGCNNKGTNIDKISPSNSDTNSIESSWISSNKDTVLARVNASEGVVCGPSYKLFDKKMTISSIYATKSKEIEIDKPNNKEISDVVRTSTYSIILII